MKGSTEDKQRSGLSVWEQKPLTRFFSSTEIGSGEDGAGAGVEDRGGAVKGAAATGAASGLPRKG